MKIIVGLGNPGREFENTYHNVGVQALRILAAPLAFKHYKKLFLFAAADSATHSTADNTTNSTADNAADNRVFVLPLTFMNESGAAVREALKKFGVEPGVEPENLTVIHDDSDLPLGAYKISMDKNSAGHHGVQSVIDALRTKNFTRVRIGIRPAKERRRKKASTFVLKTISAKDKGVLEGVFKKIGGELSPSG